MQSCSSARDPKRKHPSICAWTRVTTTGRVGSSWENGTTSPTSDASARRSSTVRERNATRQAVGSGAHIGLALEVPSHPGTLRQESRQLPGADQGCLYLAVVPSSAPSVSFEIVT